MRLVEFSRIKGIPDADGYRTEPVFVNPEFVYVVRPGVENTSLIFLMPAPGRSMEVTGGYQWVVKKLEGTV